MSFACESTSREPTTSGEKKKRRRPSFSTSLVTLGHATKTHDQNAITRRTIKQRSNATQSQLQFPSEGRFESALRIRGSPSSTAGFARGMPLVVIHCRWRTRQGITAMQTADRGDIQPITCTWPEHRAGRTLTVILAPSFGSILAETETSPASPVLGAAVAFPAITKPLICLRVPNLMFRCSAAAFPAVTKPLTGLRVLLGRMAPWGRPP